MAALEAFAATFFLFSAFTAYVSAYVTGTLSANYASRIADSRRGIIFSIFRFR